MKRKILATFICVILLLSMFPNTVKAETAGASIAVSSSSIEVGETVTLTVRLNSSVEIGSYQVTLAYDSSILEYVGGGASGGAGTLKAANYLETPKKNVSFDLKFKALASGTAKVETTDGMVVAYSSMEEKSFTPQGVKVEVKPSGENTSSEEEETTEETLSKNADLYSLAVSPGSISPAFQKDTTSYQVRVEEDVEELVVSAVSANPNATVAVNGNKELSKDENQVTIVVTAPGGNKKTYILNVVKGDPVKDTEQNGDKAEVTINSKKLHFITDSQDVVPPEGYSLADADYNGTNVLVFRSENGKITLACLADENESNYWYLYDEEKHTFSPYIELRGKNNCYILLDLPEESQFPKGTSKKEIEVEERKLEVLAFSDSETSHMYLVYAINSEGVSGFYQYDEMEGSYQRYLNTDGSQAALSNVTTESGTNQYEKYNKILKAWALLSGVIILLLLGIVFILSTKKGNDDEEEEEEEEGDEEIEELEVREEKRETEQIPEEILEDVLATSEIVATAEEMEQEEIQEEKENDMDFIQSILEGEDEIETILPEDLDNLPKVSRYNNEKDWL